MTDFGTVQLAGITYKMTDQAQPTNRAFPGCYNDVSEGESYVSEWEAPALDSDENPWRVRWLFEEAKGSETDPDMLDWDNPTWIVAA